MIGSYLTALNSKTFQTHTQVLKTGFPLLHEMLCQISLDAAKYAGVRNPKPGCSEVDEVYVMLVRTVYDYGVQEFAAMEHDIGNCPAKQMRAMFDGLEFPPAWNKNNARQKFLYDLLEDPYTNGA